MTQRKKKDVFKGEKLAVEYQGTLVGCGHVLLLYIRCLFVRGDLNSSKESRGTSLGRLV